jgi:hypothetical protein
MLVLQVVQSCGATPRAMAHSNFGSKHVGSYMTQSNLTDTSCVAFATIRDEFGQTPDGLLDCMVKNLSGFKVAQIPRPATTSHGGGGGFGGGVFGGGGFGGGFGGGGFGAAAGSNFVVTGLGSGQGGGAEGPLAQASPVDASAAVLTVGLTDDLTYCLNPVGYVEDADSSFIQGATNEGGGVDSGGGSGGSDGGDVAGGLRLMKPDVTDEAPVSAQNVGVGFAFGSFSYGHGGGGASDPVVVQLPGATRPTMLVAVDYSPRQVKAAATAAALAATAPTDLVGMLVSRWMPMVTLPAHDRRKGAAYASHRSTGQQCEIQGYIEAGPAKRTARRRRKRAVLPAAADEQDHRASSAPATPKVKAAGHWILSDAVDGDDVDDEVSDSTIRPPSMLVRLNVVDAAQNQRLKFTLLDMVNPATVCSVMGIHLRECCSCGSA